MKKAVKLLKKANSIALISHISPDPDTIGSTLALYEALLLKNKQVYLFCDWEFSDDYKFLKHFDKYSNKSDYDLSGYDLVVAVDVPSEEKLGCYKDGFKFHSNTLRLDHHTNSQNYAKTDIVLPYSACAVLIYYLIKSMNIKITQSIATSLYLAICGDTGIFRNNNTDAVTFDVCSELFKCGAEFRKVYTEFFDKKTVPYIKLTSSALLNAEINNDEKFVIMSVSLSDYKKYGASINDNIGNLPHSYLNCGYKIAVILKEHEDGIHCSFRSKYEYDVASIAEQFGGGGHKNASGCVIQGALEPVKIQVTQAISKYLKSL